MIHEATYSVPTSKSPGSAMKIYKPVPRLSDVGTAFCHLVINLIQYFPCNEQHSNILERVFFYETY
jgi:hypothetical protein